MVRGQHYKIYCVACQEKIRARRTTGAEIYPHRPDLSRIPFWKCDTCGNYVGCHWKSEDKYRPLGIIPTPEIKYARNKIHELLDPLWKKKWIRRGKLYQRIGRELGREYHTAEIISIPQARKVYKIVATIHNELIKERGV